MALPLAPAVAGVDRAFKDWTSELMLKFGKGLDTVLREAGELEQELMGQWKEKPRR